MSDLPLVQELSMKTLLLSAVLALAPGLVLAQSNAASAKTPAKSTDAKAKATPAKSVKTAKPKAAAPKKQVVAKAAETSTSLTCASDDIRCEAIRRVTPWRRSVACTW